MNKIKIILAEDHVVVREGTRQLLENEGDLEVIGEAGNGEEAVQLAAQLQPDLVIMDIAMPKLNGIEATKQIKALQPSIKVLILTAYDNDQYIFALLEAGAAGYLLKDVSSSELINAVRAVCAGESILHPVVAHKVINHFRSHGGRLEAKQSLEPLTQREMDVLKLASRGMSNKDIAQELCISVRTVQSHLGNIFNKLGVGSRAEAMMCALKRGWFTLEDLS
jgi:DNA-binding NarL/FixJ family response regulator